MPTTLEIGSTFIETIWYSLACRIVDKAIEVYKINDEKANEIKAAFLKRGNFVVNLT
jgi:hypothetical protein